jgi:hypothetical protein
MVVEGMRIKEEKEKMRIDAPYVTQELMNLDIVPAVVI